MKTSPPTHPQSEKMTRGIARFIFPPLMAVVLFCSAVFWLTLSEFEQGLMAQKKIMLQELTYTAWSVIDDWAEREQSGVLTLEQAQQGALDAIAKLRYGPEGKDYFWINDHSPVMLMHPYRTDLVGQSLKQYQDPNGIRLFVEFVEVVKRQQEGFVGYQWQWKDDPTLVVPKLSFVKAFEPWGWIVGTGIYLEDVAQEVERATRTLIFITLAVLLIIGGLSGYVAWQGIRVSRKRYEAEFEVKHHQDHLEELVNERTAQLQKALDEVTTLSGMLPICASCKKIRDDQGYWGQIEHYISEHSDAQFSHSICPECAEEHYGDLLKNAGDWQQKIREDESKES